MADYFDLEDDPNAPNGEGFLTSAIPNDLPAFRLQPSAPARGGLLGNAINAGYYDLTNSYANAASAYQAAQGNIPAANAAAEYGRQQAQAGEPYRDQALETAPWNPGGSWWNLPRQIPYQVAKQIPNVGATLAGAGVGALAGAPLGPVGSVVGGALGAFGATYPQSVGSIYGEALEKSGGQANPEAAKEAGLYGVPHALLDTGASLLPVGMFGKAAAKAGEMTVTQAAKTVLADTAKEALTEGATEGAQRLIELTQRPDMTVGQKANSFVENAFFGSIAGGGMGGVASSAGTATSQVMRALRQVPADQTNKEDIIAATSSAAPTQGDQQRAAQAAQEQAAQAQMAQEQAQAAPQPQVEGEVSFAPPEPQQPPQQPRDYYSPDRPFQGEPDENLNRVLELYTSRGDEGMANKIREEQAFRANAQQAQIDEQQRFRDEDARAVRDAARNEILNEAGLRTANARKTLPAFDYTNDTVLADQVNEELKRENPSDSVKRLAEYLGLTDDKGKPTDLSTSIAAAHDRLANAPTEEDRYKVSKHLETLTRQFDLQQRMADREKPADVQNNVKSQVLDEAQKYVSDNNIQRSKPFLDGVQKRLENGIEPVRKGADKSGWRFADELLSKQEQPAEVARPTEASTAQPVKLTDKAEQLLESTKDQELPTVMMNGRIRQIFQSEGVYDPNLSGGEMIQRLREKQAGVTNGQSTNAASGGNDVGNVGNVGNVQGSPAGPAVQGQGLAAQGQPVRQGQGQSPAAQGQGSSVQGQPVRQEGVWTVGGQSQKVSISPEVRKLGNGKEVRKVTTERGKTYYVPADQVFTGGPSASPASAFMDTTNPTPGPAVDTTAPGVRPSAPGSRRESVTSETPSTPRSATETSRKVEDTLKNVTDFLRSRKNILDMVRKGVLYAASDDHIEEVWGKVVPEITAYRNGKKDGESVRMRAAAAQMPLFKHFDKLSKAQQDAIAAIIGAETEHRVLGLAPNWFDYHDHILDDPKLTSRQKTDLRKIWEDLRPQRRTINSSPEALAAYNEHRDLNDANMFETNAILMLNLLRVIGADFALPDPHVDLQMKDDITDTPESIRKFWEGEKNKVFAAAQGYITRLNTAARDTSMEKIAQDRAKYHFDVLSEALGDFKAMEEAAAKVPYSHLGRFGDEIVSFHFPTIKEEGSEVVDPVKAKKVAEAFEKVKKTLGVTVSPATTQKYAFMRFEDGAVRQEAYKLLQELEKQGLVTNVFQGKRDISFVKATMTKSQLALLDAALKDVREDAAAFDGMSDDSTRAARAQLEKMLTNAVIDALPDNSMRKVMVSRKRITGASSDIMRSTAHRFQMNNVAIASMISGPKITQALRDIKRRSDEFGRGELPAITSDDVEFYHQIHNELATRHYQAGQLGAGNTFTEFSKALTFTGAMGLNPSSALLQLMSVLTLGFPRLGARAGVGMVRSARALTKAASPTARILATTLREAIKDDPSSIGDVTITRETLKKAGFNPDSREAKFIMRVINSGIIEMGTLARDLGDIVTARTDSMTAKATKMLRWANAMNQYMEVASRLSMAFASLEIHNPEKHGDLYEFTKSNISGSLFDFSNNNLGRLFNRSANAPTRLASTFMSYPAMWLQLLTREFDKAFFDKKTDKESRAEARKFLGMHFGMTAALAGVSGLPLAQSLFWALNQMFGDDDEPYDVENEIRSYLTMWVGKDAADVAMRGLPRLAGTDISSRVGGQDLAPFSQFMADQRGWKESVQALLSRGFGAPGSMLVSMAGGLDKIHDGDLWGGMKDLLPRGVHNMMDAVDLASGEPYRDTKGHAIPSEPGFGAALIKGTGFKSNVESDWQEVRQANDRYEKQLQRISAPIINGFKSAVLARDSDKIDYYLERARKVDADNPNLNIFKQMMSAVKGEMRSSNREELTGLPRAVDTKDPRLLETLGWAIGQ